MENKLFEMLRNSFILPTYQIDILAGYKGDICCQCDYPSFVVRFSLFCFCLWNPYF